MQNADNELLNGLKDKITTAYSHDWHPRRKDWNYTKGKKMMQDEKEQ